MGRIATGEFYQESPLPGESVGTVTIRGGVTVVAAYIPKPADYVPIDWRSGMIGYGMVVIEDIPFFVLDLSYLVYLPSRRFVLPINARCCQREDIMGFLDTADYIPFCIVDANSNVILDIERLPARQMLLKIKLTVNKQFLRYLSRRR